MRRLLIATNNPGKMKEIHSLLKSEHCLLLTPAEIGLEIAPAETGSTYAENAAIKAIAYAEASGILTLADDSGLEVDALDGDPGIHSARLISQPGANDADRRDYLLRRLKGKERPWRAKFRCVVALAIPNRGIEFAEGICDGEIIPEERGDNGFGYDPIFLIPVLGKTMAELNLEEKNQLSHRANAIRAATPLIRSYLAIP